MTKKEAIYILCNAAWLGSNEERQKVEEAVEVVANAIEALNNSEIPNSSDCIDRAEAQTAIQFAARRYTVAHEAHGEGRVVWSDNLISVTDAMNALREVPSAQPEIIRCKYCKHSKEWYRDKRRCFLWHEEGIDVFEDGYCNYAKRRTDADMRGEQDG